MHDVAMPWSHQFTRQDPGFSPVSIHLSPLHLLTPPHLSCCLPRPRCSTLHPPLVYHPPSLSPLLPLTMPADDETSILQTTTMGAPLHSHPTTLDAPTEPVSVRTLARGYGQSPSVNASVSQLLSSPPSFYSTSTPRVPHVRATT